MVVKRGHEFEQFREMVMDRAGGLACCSRQESDTTVTELNWWPRPGNSLACTLLTVMSNNILFITNLRKT